MGQSGDHRRAVISSGGARTNAVAFNAPALPVGVPVDLVVQLEKNVYGGTVEARVVIQSVHPLEKSQASGARKVGIDAGALASMLTGYHDEVPAWQRPPVPAEDRRGSSVASVLRVAAAMGRDPIAYAADPARRAVQLESLGWRGPVIGPAGLGPALELVDAGHGLVVCVDPPLDPRASAALASTSVEAWWNWSDAELTYGVHVLEREFALRPIMVSLFRGLREAGKPLPALGLLSLLPQGAAPAALGRAVRVLDDLGLVEVGDGLSSVALVSDAASDPSESAVYRNAHAIVEEARAWTLLIRPST
jgi:hypothetical protein